MRGDDEIDHHLAAGDFRRVLELALARYKDKVFRLAGSILGNPAAAEDATQEVFLKVWRALPYFKSRASLSTWIYTITRNTCLNWKAREREAPAGSEAVAAAGNPDARLLVDELLRQIPADYRRVLTLYYLEDRSYEEVADHLDLPIGTVKTYIHRAKRLLAERLAKEARP